MLFQLLGEEKPYVELNYNLNNIVIYKIQEAKGMVDLNTVS